MSKSILVIDTPHDCARCPFFSEAKGEITCYGLNEDESEQNEFRNEDFDYYDTISCHCPLTRLEKRHYIKDNDCEEFNIFVDGWNAHICRLEGDWKGERDTSWDFDRKRDGGGYESIARKTTRDEKLF